MLNSFFPVHDPVLIFAILMLIALAAPLISGRLKLSGIIGLIVTGIIIGPHGLCILERKGEIELFGAVGLLYIMFIAGLELDRAQFMRHRHHSLIFGVFTFIIPLILGALMVRYVLNFTWQASVLLASMFSSHTLLTYPIASRLGLSRQRSVTTTIGGTIITDTAAFIVLAIIVALHKDEATLFFWPSLFIYMIIYAVSVVVILPRLTKWFFRNIATDGVIAFTGVLAAAYLCAYMAYAARLEPIIGAFLAGLILNNFIPEKKMLFVSYYDDEQIVSVWIHENGSITIGKSKYDNLDELIDQVKAVYPKYKPIDIPLGLTSSKLPDPLRTPSKYTLKVP